MIRYRLIESKGKRFLEKINYEKGYKVKVGRYEDIVLYLKKL